MSNYPSSTTTPNLGLALFGIPTPIAENFVLLDTAVGGSSSVSVNGNVVKNPNFNSTTPAAPSGSSNVVFQVSGSQISAYASAGGVSSLTGDGTIFNNSASTGAVTLSLATQTANTILAGSSSGSAAAPTFRAMVVADLPTSGIWAFAGTLSGNYTSTGNTLQTGTDTLGLSSYTSAVTNSPSFVMAGSYENAATPTYAEDSWTWQNVIGSGLNGTSTLTLTHSGTTGALAVSMPGAVTLKLGTASTSTGAITLFNSSGSSTGTMTGQGNGIALTNASGAFSLTAISGLNLGGSGGTSISMSAPLTFSMNPTSNVAAYTYGTGTAATSSQSQSISFVMNGRYWNGSASATDAWTIESLVGNGTNGTSTLSFVHSGSTGVISIQLPASGSAPTSAGTAGTAGQLLYNGTKLYFCSVTGTAGSATWNSLNMTAV